MVQPEPVPNSHPLLKFTALIDGRRAVVMVDSGATSNFISQTFVTRNHIPSSSLTARRTILLADGSTHIVTRQIIALPLTFHGFTGTVSAHILPLHEYDVILGMAWLVQFNPQIDWQRRTVSFAKPQQAAASAPSRPSAATSSQTPRFTIRILPSEDQPQTVPVDRLCVITERKALDRLMKDHCSVQWLDRKSVV